MKRRTILKVTGAAAVMAATGARAQAWPNRPITLYVPFAAGGPSDMFGRTLARGLIGGARPAGRGREQSITCFGV